jgi:hypothetical protein
MIVPFNARDFARFAADARRDVDVLADFNFARVCLRPGTGPGWAEIS